MSLLPPKVRAKAKGDAYPEKVLRARAIPLSHSLHVSIFLTLPESHYNRQLGMFQVCFLILADVRRINMVLIGFSGVGV